MSSRKSHPSLRRAALLTTTVAALAFGAGASAQRAPTVDRPYAESIERVTDASPMAPTAALSARQFQGDPAAPVIAPRGNWFYIVQLKDAPVAQYRGGVAGLAAIPRNASRGDRTDVRSPQASAYASFLENKQAQFVASLGQRFGAAPTQLMSYQFAFNGVVLKLSDEQLAQVQARPDVGLVEPLALLELNTDVGPAFIGAPAIWNGTATGGAPGSAGEGMVIADIDSGVNWGSDSFADVGDDGYDHTNPLGAGNYLGLCAGQVGAGDPVNGPACNDKVIGAYANSFDFVQQVNYECANPDDPDNTLGFTPEDCASVGVPLTDFDNALDENGHGSHTASTAAGNVSNIVYQGNNLTISGVAKHANLIIYDTCHTNITGQGSCFNVATLAATEQVVEDGIVDAINYSIGGGTSPWTQANAQAFLAAVDAGVFVSASAGNSGPTAGSVAHVEPWVSTVANGTHTRAAIAPGYSVTGPGTPTPAVVNQPANIGTAGSPHIANIAGSLVVSPDFNVVPTATTGDGCLPYASGAFAGSVALVRRGGCNFSIKATSARTAGAIAIIIASHPTSANPENPIAPGQTTPPGPVDVPVFGIKASQGTALAAYAAANPGTQISIPVAGIIASTQGDVVNASSSRGPGTLEMIKPDIMGPGTNILAAVAGAPDAHDQYTGTSMSSPHNAGAAVLVRAIHPEWTVAEVKSAMMMTSKNSGLTKQDGVTTADPFDRGAGRINLNQAALSGLVMNETTLRMFQANPATGGDPSLLNIASLNSQECIGTCTFSRKFRSVASVPVTYAATFANASNVTMTVNPSTFTVNPGQTVTLNITANTSAATGGQWHFGELTLAVTAPAAPIYTQTTTPPSPIAIPDGQYAGGFGGVTQACVTVDTTAGIPAGFSVAGARLTVAAAHTWLGDLTFKLRSPNGTTLGILSQAGVNEAADDGTGSSGESSNLLATFPITFRDGATASAESMGVVPALSSSQVVCRDLSSPCEYSPAPGAVAQPPSTFAGFAGSTAAGAWIFCAGDSDNVDTGSITSVKLDLLGASTIPALHLPVAVFAVDAVPEITLDPTSLAVSGVENGPVVSAELDIGNTGAVDLVWDADSATNIAGVPIYSQLMNLTENPGSGFSTGFYTGNAGHGVFLSDSFTLTSAQEIGSLYVDGFTFTATPDLAYQDVTFWIFPDVAGKPAGNPETSPASAVFTYNATIGDPELDVELGEFGGSIRLDLTAAGEALNLPAGKYWIVVAPINGATGAPNTDEWFWLGTGASLNRDDVAQIIDPANILNGNITAWVPLEPLLAAPNNVRFRGLSFLVSGAATTCGAPWLSVDPSSGTVAPDDEETVDVLFDPTGLAPGTYSAVVCIASNDPDVPVSGVPVTFEVAGLPSTDPTATGLATPDSVAAGGVTLLTVDVTEGTNPTSTGITVVADLTAIGGSATQAFADDGTGGDLAAGDGIFSYSATVSPGTAPGAKTLTATVTDAQSRTTSADIALTVTGTLPDAIFADGFED